MRYYSNDWVYTAGAISGKGANTKTRVTGNEGLAKGITFLLPLLIFGLLYLFLGKKDDPKQATALVISGSSSGTGCVFTADGYILTNRHVISDTSKIRVLIGSGTQKQQSFQARLVQKGEASGATATTLSEFLKQLPNDFAILKVEAKDLSYFRLADDSQRPRSGLKVSAIGYGATMIQGSDAKGPSQETPTGVLSGFLPNEGEQRLYIHTCTIQKGFSGGPLIDEQGRLLGINTASVPDDIGNNKQVAIPISTFKATLNSFIKGSGH